MDSTVVTLRDFIVRELQWDEEDASLTTDYPLIQNHVIDSLGFLTLLTFIEEQFGVAIADEELVPENFETLESIARLVERKFADLRSR